MIELREKQKIIKLYLEGMSQRKISKETNKSRNTVKKYIDAYEESKKKDIRNLPITEDILSPPIYKKRKGKKSVLTEEIAEILRGFIKENEWKKQNSMAKQQMKIIDMHEKLLDMKYTISYTTVRNFINNEIQKTKEVFIRKHCLPGQEVEFDWGEIKLEIGGQIKSYSLAVFTLAYSNYRFARIYESETQICVLDVHTRFIEHVGFIPMVFTYDNMRTVVKSFIGTEKTITERMKHLSDYYQFKIRLCGPKKGNEKGHVERSVEFIRRKAFSYKYSFLNLDEAKQHLLEAIQKLNERIHHEHRRKNIELLNEERQLSNPAISPFDVSELTECRVDKYSTVVIKQNHYSVPEGLVGKYIKVKIGAETIKLFNEGELIAQHSRNWGIHQWEMNINHYLKTFQKKKGALPQSECMRQAPTAIKNLYKNYYIGKEKDFIELLLYIQEKQNLDRVLQAIEQLNSIRSGYVTTERILFICEQSTTSSEVNFHERDETMKQSELNMKAYADLFEQYGKGVLH